MFHVKFMFVFCSVQKLRTSVCSGLLVLMSYWKQITDLMWLLWCCLISTKKELTLTEVAYAYFKIVTPDRISEPYIKWELSFLCRKLA